MATYQEQIEKAARRREIKEQLTMAALRGDQEEVRRLNMELKYGEGQASDYFKSSEEGGRHTLGDLLWWKINRRAMR